ncbi:hypothetical protein [Lysinibacillus sp. NPDC093216]|uniref:hypothetical protein n=1 Tax=Lysinibacillus sp. NPDC093216 TaxID=3390576 RepID=UPI003CFCCC0C
MPILNHSSVQILFGKGDVGVSVGCNKERNSGAIQITKINPVPVGTKLEGTKMLDLNDAPVTLGFTNVESLDVVINQFLKLRHIMSGEDEYEWTANGRIIEKE